MKRIYIYSLDSSVIDLKVTSISPTSFSITWDSLISTANFKVEYELTRLDQCSDVSGDPITLPTGTNKFANVSGLEQNSDYSIKVTSSEKMTCASNEVSTSITTDEAG